MPNSSTKIVTFSRLSNQFFTFFSLPIFTPSKPTFFISFYIYLLVLCQLVFSANFHLLVYTTLDQPQNWTIINMGLGLFIADYFVYLHE